MPVVQIQMWPGRDTETKKALIERVSQTVSDTISCPLEAVTVVIEEIPKENWGIRGSQAT